ncbi:hypothetical protein [Vibrio neptunius]|uniref:Uncharacterized protein n=1 Tax=Vibrio neptunius TaxID=170651 RepID=A0ABS3A1R4_9VIBR|nr:hypothetical protein [Vibrio neptunius]MBN3492493.1 hypothetical protein [Vibrio neptunius]MBN3514990.1 hypothetical protein [Vibrio neptunius]MBN3548750.1 hypothetical protein [Vibrio neptunius]MBN3577118.1 hypothetical protein [Vibrio neptunius]MCH9870783.1 hypothetical protein [Vibrio neptunius]
MVDFFDDESSLNFGLGQTNRISGDRHSSLFPTYILVKRILNKCVQGLVIASFEVDIFLVSYPRQALGD